MKARGKSHHRAIDGGETKSETSSKKRLWALLYSTQYGKAKIWTPQKVVGMSVSPVQGEVGVASLLRVGQKTGQRSPGHARVWRRRLQPLPIVSMKGDGETTQVRRLHPDGRACTSLPSFFLAHWPHARPSGDWAPSQQAKVAYGWPRSLWEFSLQARKTDKTVNSQSRAAPTGRSRLEDTSPS